MRYRKKLLSSLKIAEASDYLTILEFSLYIRAYIEPLNWENQFFGISSAIIQLDENAPILTEKNLAKWSRIQAKIPAGKTEYLDALQCLGFRLVESEINFIISVRFHEYEDNCSEIAKKEDIFTLRQIAMNVFSRNRFRTPWYTSDANGRFYSQWIENAVLGIFDDICLVIRNINREIQGFVSLRYLNSKEVRIGLLAGHGIGEKLIRAALFWAQRQNVINLHITTQISNIAAIKCYVASGAIATTTAYWLYR